MNKFNIWDKVLCIINYLLVEWIITAIYKKHDNIIYDVEYDWYEYTMYDYELGKIKEELKSQLEQKIKDLQWILDSMDTVWTK